MFSDEEIKAAEQDLLEPAKPDTSQLKQSLFVAQRVDPVRQADVLNISKKVGVAPGLVDSQYDRFKGMSEATPQDMDRIAQEAPSLAEWMKDPNNAALAKQEVDRLAEIEKKTSIIKDITPAPLRSGFSRLGADTLMLGAAYGLASPEQVAEKIAELKKTEAEIQAGYPGFVKEYSEASQNVPLTKDVKRFVGSYSEFVDGKIKDALINYFTGGRAVVGDVLHQIGIAAMHPRGFAYSTLENAPNALPSLVLSAVGGLSGLAAGPAAPIVSTAASAAGAFSGSMVTEVGGWIDEAMTKRGYDLTNPEDIKAAFSDSKFMEQVRGEALRKGLATSAVDAMFNVMAGKFLHGAAKGVAAKVEAGLQETAVQSVGEALGEAAGQAAAKKDVSQVDVNESILEGIQSLGQSVGEVAIGASRRALYSATPEKAAVEVKTDVDKALRAQQSALVIQNIGEAVKELQTTTKVEGKLTEVLNLAAPDTKVLFQMSDWDEYWNKKGLSPVKAAEQIFDGGGEKYHQAKTVGGDLEIPFSQYVERVGKTEDFNGLNEILRAGPEEMSLRESRDVMKSLGATLNDIAKEAKEAQPLAPLESEKQIVADLQKAGASKEEIAKAPLIHREFVNLLSKELKMTPADVERMFPAPTIEKGGVYTPNDWDRTALEKMRVELDMGEHMPGGFFPMESRMPGPGGKFFPSTSSYPKWFQNRGYTKKAAMSAIDKLLANKPLTEKQQSMMQELGRASGAIKSMDEIFLQQGMAPAFYSKLQSDIEQKLGNSATVEQVNAILRDVKAEERKWSGIDAFLKGKDKVNKEELLQFLKANELQIKEVRRGGAYQPEIGQPVFEIQGQGADGYGYFLDRDAALSVSQGRQVKEVPYPGVGVIEDAQFSQPETTQETKFSKYTLPGGENYREILFTLPSNKFESSHFDELGIFAHARVTDRVSTDIAPGFVQSKSDQARADSLTSYSKTLSDLLKSKAFVSKGLDGLNAQDRKSMISSVVGAVGDTEVLRSVISLVPVDVMDDIVRGKSTPDKFFSDNSMLSDSLSGNPNADVKFGSGSLRSLISTIADLAAKEADASLKGVGFSVDGKATSKTGGVVGGHKESRILFIEEIQSDLHQKGRKEGYKGDSDAELRKLKDELSEIEAKVKESGKDASGATLDRATEIMHRIQNLEGVRWVPDAPFRSTWHEFVLKRLIREAAEKGYDKVAWTTGEQQADRYDLSKQVDQIVVHRYKGGDGFQVSIRKGGRDIVGRREVTNLSELEGVIGKEPTAKLIEQEKRGVKTPSISGVDLKVGGEGMKGFYDKILVDSANKLGKKFGAKVEETKIESGKTDEAGTDFPSLETVHSLPITPALKAQALNQGFPLFQANRRMVRGQFDPIHNVIRLFEHKNKSTFLHEYFHFMFDVLARASMVESANPEFKKHLQTLLDEVGAKSFGEVTTEQHEKLARTWEAYLMEGKAPNSRLLEAFRAFKKWMIETYKNLAGLIREAKTDIVVSPEIRKVFDFLLNAEDSVDEVAKQFPPADPKKIGMSDAETEKYMAAMADAREKTIEKITSELIASDKDAMKAREGSRAAVEAEVRKQVDESPLYKAVADLQADNLKISEDSLRALDVDPSTFLPGTVDQEGMDVGFAATLYGFDTGEFIELMKNAVPKEEAIKKLTNQRLIDLHPSPLATDAAKQAAINEYIDNNRAKVLRMELEFLAQNNLPVLKGVVKKAIRRLPTTQDIVKQATKLINETNLHDLKLYQFQRAAARAAKLAGEAIAKGDFETSFSQKQREALAIEMHKQAVDALGEVAKSKTLFKKVLGKDEDIAKTRDMDFVNAARALLADLGLTKSDKGAKEYLKNLAKYDEQAYLALSEMIDTVGKPDPDKITYGEFYEVKELVRALWSLARESRQIIIDGQKMDKQVAIDAIKPIFAEKLPPEPAIKRAKTDREKLRESLFEKKAWLRTVTSWAEAWDGGPNGTIKKFLVREVNDSTPKARNRTRKFAKEYAKAFKDNKELFKQTPIPAPEFGYEFKNTAELVGAIMHIGNDSNKAKNLVGRGWATLLDDGSIDYSKWEAFRDRMHKEGKLTKAHYDFVQNQIWNKFEETKPEAQKAHKARFGRYFAEITATPVKTPWGDLPGGYVPAHPDYDYVLSQAEKDQKEIGQKTNDSAKFPTVSAGFGKSRVAGYRVPLNQNLMVVPAQMDWLFRFIEIDPVVRQSAKIIRDQELHQIMNKVDPGAVDQMLIPWLERAINQGEKEGKSARFFNQLRKVSSASFLLGNITNTLQNLAGFFPASIKVPYSRQAAAFHEFVTNRTKLVEDIVSVSPFMDSLLAENVVESRRAVEVFVRPPTKRDLLAAKAEQLGAVLQAATQNIVNIVVWRGAYNHAVIKKMENPVAYADDTVRTTQGSFNPEDLSRLHAKRGLTSLFTALTSYFNMKMNLYSTSAQNIYKEHGFKGGSPYLFLAWLNTMAVPSFIAAMIAQGMSGKDLDEDGDGEVGDELVKMFFLSQLGELVAGVPGGGAVGKYALNKFDKKWSNDRLQITPLETFLESAIGGATDVPKSIFEGEEWKNKNTRDVLNLMSLVTGVPVTPIAKPINYLRDVSSGKAQPTGPIDFTRGLVTGKPGKQ